MVSCNLTLDLARAHGTFVDILIKKPLAQYFPASWGVSYMKSLILKGYSSHPSKMT